MLGIKVLLRAGVCRPREKLARSITSLAPALTLTTPCLCTLLLPAIAAIARRQHVAPDAAVTLDHALPLLFPFTRLTDGQLETTVGKRSHLEALVVRGGHVGFSLVS